VLFSNDQVAEFVNQNFEPAWEMVRPVPMVRIDFGNGRVVTRTLHGNIASHLCAADGSVVDILPGIYTPVAYRNSLDQVRLAAIPLVIAEGNARIARNTRMGEYHRQQILVIRRNQAQAIQPLLRDMGKGKIELPVERIIAANPGLGPNGGSPNGRSPLAQRSAVARARAAATPAEPAPSGISPETWQLLVQDTQINETQRRLQIHEKLAGNEPVRPEQVKTWLYKNVLNADLDDPYLGPGGVLFGGDVSRLQPH
jgi:hypothetical protein